jgi:hypothetical protein
MLCRLEGKPMSESENVIIRNTFPSTQAKPSGEAVKLEIVGLPVPGDLSVLPVAARKRSGREWQPWIVSMQS